jgi:hypothetical protein
MAQVWGTLNKAKQSSLLGQNRWPKSNPDVQTHPKGALQRTALWKDLRSRIQQGKPLPVALGVD